MNVVLISRDHRLGAILTMALPAPEQLTVLGSPAEVPDSLQPEIDAVVLDLPADSRRDAYDELRQRYEGHVLVPVDNATDTSGWPPDAKRRFLVRPFQVADLIAGVQEPKETSVAERAARYRRRFRWNRHQVPAFPTLTGTPSGTDEPSEAPWTAAEEPPAEQEPPAASDEQAEDDGDEPEASSGDPRTVAAVEDADTAGDAQATEAEEEQAAAAAAEAEPTAATEDEQDDGAVAAQAEDDEASARADAVAEAEDDEPSAQADADAEAEDDEPSGRAVAEAEDDAVVTEEAQPTAEADEDDEPSAEGRAEEDDEPAVEEDDEVAVDEDDEALLGELEGLVLADAGEELRPDPAERPAESSEEDRDAGLPPLPVQASVAMAEAVALQQWLEAEEAKRLRRRHRLVIANIAAGLVLLLAGIGVGRAMVPEQPQQVTPPPAPPRQEVQVHDAPPPAACTAAMDNADQVISYLVAKIRDERLSKSIQAYGANARACRAMGR
jgi:hypothetical protein